MPLFDVVMSNWLVYTALVSAIGASALAPSFRSSNTLSSKLRSSCAPLCSNFYNDFDDFSISSTLSTESDPLLTALSNRKQQIEDASTKLPLIILDSMLPRQVLDIQLSHPTLKNLISHRIQETERPTLGMLGMIKTTQGFVPLTNGVEVEIVECEPAQDNPDGTTTNNENAWDVTLKAKRRFSVTGELAKAEGGWTESRVMYIDSKTEEELQQKKSERESGQDPLSLARAMSKSKQFTQPNANIKNNLSIIERWIELARENERFPHQIDNLLDQLGDIPPEDQPTERALWIGALVNPLPALGVAMEIRPSLLMAKSAEERVDIALGGVWASIKHMEGSAKMW